MTIEPFRNVAFKGPAGVGRNDIVACFWRSHEMSLPLLVKLRMQLERSSYEDRAKRRRKSRKSPMAFARPRRMTSAASRCVSSETFAAAAATATT